MLLFLFCYFVRKKLNLTRLFDRDMPCSSEFGINSFTYNIKEHRVIRRLVLILHLSIRISSRSGVPGGLVCEPFPPAQTLLKLGVEWWLTTLYGQPTPF